MSKRKIRHDYLQYHFSNIRKSLGVDLLLLSPSLINLKKGEQLYIVAEIVGNTWQTQLTSCIPSI